MDSCTDKTEQVYDCIVIGGGISGISFAHNLSRIGQNVLVFEKKRNIGGQVQTYTSTVSPDFWVEMGAHTCYNSYTRLLSMILKSGLKDKILPLNKSRYVIFTKNGIKSIFSQMISFSLMFNGIKVFFSWKEKKSVKEYFRPIVGEKNYDRLFRQLFRAVICQPADDYPAELFLKKRKGRMAELPRKYSFEGGLQTMLESIVEKDSIKVRTHTEVTNIVAEENGYRICTTDGAVFHTRNIAFAADPRTTSQLLKDTEPAVSNLLNTIALSYSETLSLIIKKDDIGLQAVAGIIPVSDEFMSVVSRDVAEHPYLRGFSIHFGADGKSEKEKLDIACHVLTIKQTDIMEYCFTSHTLPSPHKEHIHIAGKIEDIRTQEHFFVLGNYFYGLSLEDCIHRSEDEFVRYKTVNKFHSC